MNYEELELKLKSSITYANSNDKFILEYFKKKFSIYPYENDIMFVFDNNREFENRNHMVAIHKRNSGCVPMHIYNYIVITYVYSGKFTMKIEDKTITLYEGDVVIFDKRVPHSVGATGKDDLGINIIINEKYFFNNYINKLPNNELLTQFIIELMNNKHNHDHYLLFFTQKDYLVHNCIQNILCEHFDPNISSDIIIDNYIMILITHLTRKFQYNTNISKAIFKNNELYNQILCYIKKNYQEGNLMKMCEHFGYDTSYTSKLIKNFFGKTFKQMINEERMKRTIILLEDRELTIYEIADRVGINNLTSFYKRFQEYAGCTPQEYRDKIMSVTESI